MDAPLSTFPTRSLSGLRRLLLAPLFLAGCGLPSDGGNSSAAAGGKPMTDNGGLFPSHPDCEGAGTWYLQVGARREVLQLGAYPGPNGECTGVIGDETAEPTDVVDSIHRTWDGGISFRHSSEWAWSWYHVKITDGVMVGRLAPTVSPEIEPDDPATYDTHVTGWRAETFDAELAPRVWDILIEGNAKARIRLDRSMTSPSGFEVRYKTWGSIFGNIGESDSYEAIVDEWDGRILRFHINVGDDTEEWGAEVSGRIINGDWRWAGQADPAGVFTGARAEVLSHGFSPVGADARSAWQQRTRRRLEALVMADNPTPSSSAVTILRSGIAPFEAKASLPDRDDGDLARFPQAYHLDEWQIEAFLPNPTNGDALARRIHGYLAVPDGPAPPDGFPVAVALNGHDGSAHAVMEPDNELFWYGDSFARRGYMVLAVDISHRPVADRSGLYTGTVNGDDAANGNGPHPSIRADGLDSDWEEDGERAWDVMRAIDWVAGLPDVNSSRMLVTGLSMGGEITNYVGALDPRVGMVIAAGFSPDLSVLLQHGSHGCWRWNHAEIREYIDTSDLFALAAPRPLVVETGKVDWTFSWLAAPWAADKQVMRAARAAYDDPSGRVFHYLHYDKHHYHVGSPTGTMEPEVQIPVQIEPPAPDSLDWQRDGETMGLGEDLFGLIARELP